MGGSLCVRVLLRHAHLGLYYAGRKHWVSNPDSALELDTIERATEVSRDEDFAQMEIVVSFREAGCDLVLPVKGPPPNSDRAEAA